jgi:hypothetical protein
VRKISRTLYRFRDRRVSPKSMPKRIRKKICRMSLKFMESIDKGRK